MTGRKGIDQDGTGVGEDVRGAEGGETVIKIYFIQEKNLFSIKRKTIHMQ